MHPGRSLFPMTFISHATSFVGSFDNILGSSMFSELTKEGKHDAQIKCLTADVH